MWTHCINYHWPPSWDPSYVPLYAPILVCFPQPPSAVISVLWAPPSPGVTCRTKSGLRHSHVICHVQHFQHYGAVLLFWIREGTPTFVQVSGEFLSDRLRLSEGWCSLLTSLSDLVKNNSITSYAYLVFTCEWCFEYVNMVWDYIKCDRLLFLLPELLLTVPLLERSIPIPLGPGPSTKVNQSGIRAVCPPMFLSVVACHANFFWATFHFFIFSLRILSVWLHIMILIRSEVSVIVLMLNKELQGIFRSSLVRPTEVVRPFKTFMRKLLKLTHESF